MSRSTAVASENLDAERTEAVQRDDAPLVVRRHVPHFAALILGHLRLHSGPVRPQLVVNVNDRRR